MDTDKFVQYFTLTGYRLRCPESAGATVVAADSDRGTKYALPSSATGGGRATSHQLSNAQSVRLLG